MGFAISRRTAYVLASVAVAAGLLKVLAGPPATSDAVDPASGSHATPLDMLGVTRTIAGSKQASTLTPAAAKLLTALAHRTTGASDGGDLFASHSWYVAPPPPPPSPAQPAAPTAPPFPYAYLGSYAEGGNQTVYFLARNDRVYDVRPGDTLDQIYSVDGVENDQLIFTYKPLNIRQTLPIGVRP